MKSYVERRDGGYWIAGTRVSLDSVAYGFLRGQTPEGIADSFPVLTLEQVYGAITFYLANRPEVDAYLRQGEEEFEQLSRSARAANPRLYAKLDAARQTAVTPRR